MLFTNALCFRYQWNVPGCRLDLVTGHAENLAVIQDGLATKAVRNVVVEVKLSDREPCAAALALALPVATKEGFCFDFLGKLAAAHALAPISGS